MATRRRRRRMTAAMTLAVVVALALHVLMLAGSDGVRGSVPHAGMAGVTMDVADDISPSRGPVPPAGTAVPHVLAGCLAVVSALAGLVLIATWRMAAGGRTTRMRVQSSSSAHAGRLPPARVRPLAAASVVLRV